ncbi:MAG: hypothetical protein GX268_11050 [Methanomicrobiales archaeon]|nr:hypothetical protein [Methanomicrobiales archaeon]
MTYSIRFRRSAATFLFSLPKKSQRIVKEKLSVLMDDPYPGGVGDKELLQTKEMDVFRIHISRSFTAIYLIHSDTPEKWVEITHIMTIEQAHKLYGRL